MSNMNLLSIAIIVFILNIPFGYWRANVRKFSRQWFLSVHIPIPIVIALRIFSGLGWHFITFPVLIGYFFLGQFLGGMLRSYFARYIRLQITSCIFLDLIKIVHAFKF